MIEVIDYYLLLMMMMLFQRSNKSRIMIDKTRTKKKKNTLMLLQRWFRLVFILVIVLPTTINIILLPIRADAFVLLPSSSSSSSKNNKNPPLAAVSNNNHHQRHRGFTIKSDLFLPRQQQQQQAIRRDNSSCSRFSTQLYDSANPPNKEERENEADATPTTTTTISPSPYIFDTNWNIKYEQLVEFKRRFGHCRVPYKWNEDPIFGRWVNTQRDAQSKGTLRQDREAKLNELQFTWRGQDIMLLTTQNKWNASYQKLVEYKQTFGHCRVPVGRKEDSSLGSWVAVQRHLQSTGKLQPDREAKLNEIQFTWSERIVRSRVNSASSETIDKKWNASFQKLIEFKSRFGHCDVPLNWKEDPFLGRWVATQRSFQSGGRLRQDRKAKLDELQFAWRSQSSQTSTLFARVRDAKWNIFFDKLVEFKKTCGHCRVPYNSKCKDDLALASWVSRQRNAKTKGTLRSDREVKLNEIQFDWNNKGSLRSMEMADAKWNATYQKLVEFKIRFGHCQVPQGWKDDPVLASWVSRQRNAKTKGTLRSDREAKLNEIQFDWNNKGSLRSMEMADAKWNATYQELVEFQIRFGHCQVPQGWKDDPFLASWVNRQRNAKTKGTLWSDREAKLNELQFTWRVVPRTKVRSVVSDAYGHD